MIDTANNTISGTVTVGTTPIGVAIATAPLTELQITQPLSPTQPNTFTFGTANYAARYLPGTQFSNVNMAIKEVEITQAEFQQRVVGTNYASAACIVYGGTGGNCVDHQVTCSDNNGTPITCPTASAIDVQTSFMAPQSVVNPGYLTTPIGQNQWQNIFSGYYAIEQLITVKGEPRASRNLWRLIWAPATTTTTLSSSRCTGDRARLGSGEVVNCSSRLTRVS